MSTIDIKNKFIIYKLVEKYFDLTKESLELFKFGLFFDTSIPKQYIPLLGNGVEKRKYYELNDADLSHLDKGWDSFQSYFPSFISENNITYSHFRKNSFPIGKTSYKLLKALQVYYLDYRYPLRFIFDFLNVMDIEVIRVINQNKTNNKMLYIRSVNESEKDPSKLRVSYKSKDNSNKAVEIKLDEKINKEIFESIKDNFISYVKEITDRIGVEKMPNKKLFLVFSLNYADWFLSATGESWNTCLDLNGQYSYWSGLPSLIVDKNRALIYITDKQQKECFGIKVDRIIARSWLLLTNEENNKGITFVKTYPNEINLRGLIESSMSINLIEPSPNSRSMYKFEILFHNYSKARKLVSSIFEDTSSLKLIKKNNHYFGKHIFSYDYGKNNIIVSNKGTIKNVEDDFYYIVPDTEKEGLSYLIEQNKNLSHFRCLGD